MATTFLKKIIPVLSGIVLISVLFFPPIRLSKSLPVIEFIDLLLPVLAVFIFIKRREIEQKKFLYLVLGFAGFIFITIIVNSRLTFMRDYFEILKIIKFLIVIVLFSFINPENFLKKWIKPAFVLLVVFNLIHYYNLFNINELLEVIYVGNGRYLEFGLDSLGFPTHKRMLGFTANPNSNALIFLIFTLFFIPKKDSTYSSFIWFFVALTMMFLCQSRTAMISLVPVILVYAFTIKDLKKIAVITGFTIVSFLVAYGTTKISIASYSGDIMYEGTDSSVAYVKPENTYLEVMAHGQFLKGSSMRGRYEIWKHLWVMIKEKPIFGHGPNKEYFYDNKLYAENEYILMAWRYGFIGLGIYLSILASLIVLALKNLNLNSAVNLLLICVVVLVTSMTNHPFATKTVLILFAIATGLFFSELNASKKEKK